MTLLIRLWRSLERCIAHLFRRAPPQPGRYDHGAKFSWRGWLYVAPWVWPRREYVVYVPRGHSAWRRRPLLVLVHGCKQSPEEIAAGSRIEALADELECIVLLPRQHPRANAWGCWNWFDRRTAAGRGEAAILAAQIRSVRRRYRVHRKRVFAAGLSAGAALLAVLALHQSRLFAGIMFHSGLAAGAASSPMTALGVLKRGPDGDVVALAQSLRDELGSRAATVPALVLHGTRDDYVAPLHADELVRQLLAFARHRDVAPAPAPLPEPDVERVVDAPEARRVELREWRVDGRLVVRQLLVDGLGHAWSGGDANVRFNDPRPPEATALLRAFMADVVQ